MVWVAVLAGVISVIGAMKLVFYECGPRFQSPSGHSAFSAVFYGCAALLVAVGQRPAVRTLGGLGALALIAAISLSRVWLGYHSWEEVTAGLSIGALGVLAFWRVCPPLDRPVLTLPVLAAVLGLGLLLAGGRHFGIEGLVYRAQAYLPSFDVCP